MSYRCPECGSYNIIKVKDTIETKNFKYYKFTTTFLDVFSYKCLDCEAEFDEPAENVNASNSCPSCKSDNITYYSKPKNGKHYYCNDCGTRW